MTEDLNGADAGAADDLHADLAAAFDAPAEPAAQEPAGDAPVAQDGPARDEHGRFAAKQPAPSSEPAAKPQDAAQGAQQQAPAVTAQESQADTSLRPPPGWSIAAKTAFAALPKEVQEAVAKREQEVNDGFAKLAEYKGIDKAIEPFLPALTMRGVTPAQAIKQLFDAQAVLDRDPVNGIAWLARSYGVDLRQFAQAPGNGQHGGHQPNPLAQYLDPLVREINALKGHLTQQQQQAVEHQRSQAAAEIQAFSADPKRIYFEDLKEDMALLIQNGRAKDLAEAYDMAAWAHPTIRAALIKEQQAAAMAETQRKAAEVTANARRAAGSIAGAPVPGSQSLEVAPPDTIEAAIAQAWTEAGGRL